MTRLIRSAFSLGWRKTTTSPRLGRLPRMRPSNGGKSQREAVARIAVGPFRDDQIIADVERRQHRSRRDAERRDDEAAEHPGDRMRAIRMKRSRLHALSRSRCCRQLAAGRCGVREIGAVHRPLVSALAARSSRGGIWRAGHYVRAAMRNPQQHAAQRARRAVRGRARPAQPPELRSRRPLFRLVEDASRPEPRSSEFARARGADGLRAPRATRLFAGEIVNPSEGRPATHVAERGSGAPEDVDLATARRQRMRALVDAIEAGAFGDVTGVLHIGIGGSVLGPALLVDALGRRPSPSSSALPVEHRRRRVRRCGEAARSRDDAGRRRLEDLHDARNAGQPRRGARLAARRRSRGSGRPGDRGHRAARRRRVEAGHRRNPHPASSAKASAGAIRCGARSA